VFAGYRHLEGIHPGLLMGIHVDEKAIACEQESGTAEPEILCCTHELQEVWNGKAELME